MCQALSMHWLSNVAKDLLGRLSQFEFPNIAEHVSIWHYHGVPIFYSVQFLPVPKIFEPLLKGSWQWMGFLTASIWIHKSCLRISFVADSPKSGDPGWHDASRCQAGLGHCWVSPSPAHEGSAIPSYERTQVNFLANPKSWQQGSKIWFGRLTHILIFYTCV